MNKYVEGPCHGCASSLPGAALMNAALITLALVIAALLIAALPAAAHEGHDHGPAEASPPPRQAGLTADGQVFLPLAKQQGLRFSTLRSTGRAAAMSARIVPDTTYSAQLRGPRAGRLEPPQGGFPALGTRVKKGQLLAWLRPSFDRSTQNDLNAEREAIDQEVFLNQQKLDQFTLGLNITKDSVPTPQLMQLRANYKSAVERQRVYQQGMTLRTPIRAPIDGILSRADLSVDRTVSAGELFGEVIDPQRFMVEVLSADLDSEPAPQLQARTASGEILSLNRLGVSQRLVGQSLLALYAIRKPPAHLAVGQAIRIVTTPKQGLRIPKSALVAGKDGPRVWVRAGPERFALRSVGVRAAGADVELLTGIKPGEDVVLTPSPALQAYRPKP